MDKIIYGVPKIGWEKGMYSTFHGSLWAVLQALGDPQPYHYLMGISGHAFRVQTFEPFICPCSPDATCGFNTGEVALRALGYDYIYRFGKEGDPSVSEMKKLIIESIDKGIPVIAIDLRKFPDWGVIVGYRKGGEEFLCRTYHDESDEYSTNEKWPWAIYVLEEKKERQKTREEIVLNSLRIAIKLAHAEKFPIGDNFLKSGFAALEHWIEHLKNEAYYQSLGEEEFNNARLYNAWNYISLIDARSCAVKYLQEEANTLEASSGNLLYAAKIYSQIVNVLKNGRKYALYPWEEGSWGPEERKKEIEVLKEVLKLEKEAINAINEVVKKYYSNRS